MITEWSGTGTLRPHQEEYPESVFRDIGTFLASMHNLDIRWYDEFSSSAHESTVYSVKCPGFVPMHAASKRKVTSHGDFSCGNIVTGTRNGIGGMQIIDFDESGASYAIHDLAAFLGHCGKHKRAFLQSYLHFFGEETDHSVETLLNDAETAGRPGCRHDAGWSL